MASLTAPSRPRIAHSARRLWAAGPARRAPPQGGAQSLRLGLTLEPGMSVGLLGGSFNPAHEGHAHVAETARVRLGLDRVIWLVSPQNPLKTGNGQPALAERMASARAAARGPRMLVSDAEARLGVRYTYDTLVRFKARWPGVRFVWIMGGDNLAGFHRWRGWVDILRLMPVAVVSRPGALLSARFAPAARRFAFARLPASRAAHLAAAPPPAWVWLAAPLHPQSSTAIRAAAAPGRAASDAPGG